MVFIRFNPDAYVNSKGTRIISCWGHDQKRFLRVKPSKQQEWQDRLLELSDTIQFMVDSTPTKEITILQLFYDGYE